jgi:hypothetical protein
LKRIQHNHVAAGPFLQWSLLFALELGFGMSLFGFGFGPIWLALCLGLKQPQQHFAAA